MIETSRPGRRRARSVAGIAAPRPRLSPGLLLGPLRTGDWLDAARMRAYCAIVLAATAVAVAGLWVTGHAGLDAWGRPLGTDFSQVWVAGREVWAGTATAPFDPALHAAAQRAAFGAEAPFYGWHYPPYFLAVAAALAPLPYGPALLLWQGTTLALYLGAVLAILRGVAPAAPVLLAAAAFPAVFVNLTHGHNGFLTAALLAGGLLALRRRPLLAGVLFALLAYKPQFALAIPVALMAGRHWRALAAAAATLLAMTAASVAAFGTGSWRAFAGSLGFTRTVVLEGGNTGWEKIQSTFAAARMVGAGLPASYAAQGLVTAAVLLVLALVWRSGSDARLKAALLPVATLLTTPYSLDYDMTALAPALAFAAAQGLRRGFAPWEKSLLALAWAAPGLARPVAGATHLPLGVVAMGLLFASLAHRARPPGAPPPRAAVPTGLTPLAPEGGPQGRQESRPMPPHSPLAGEGARQGG